MNLTGNCSVESDGNNSVVKNSSDLSEEGTIYTCAFTVKFRALSIVISVLIIVTVCFGNSLILITLRRYGYQFKGTLYKLIGHLAVADFLLAVGYVFHMAGYTTGEKEISKYLCVLKTSFVSISVICSTKIIMFMSLDRFFAIVFPMKHIVKSNQQRRRRIAIGFIWTSSIVVSSTPVILSIQGSKSKSTNELYCKFGDFVPHIISIIASIAIPLQFLINLALYIVVIWRIKTNNMSDRKYTRSTNKCSIMVKVYVIYILCWTPFIVLTFLMEASTVVNKRQKYFCAREKAFLIGCLNSGINWVIYGLCNQRFRMSFKNVLMCRKEGHIQNRTQLSSLARS